MLYLVKQDCYLSFQQKQYLKVKLKFGLFVFYIIIITTTNYLAWMCHDGCYA
jgi:hypothetical protein